jgi:tRNA pseudouridine55 synthase
MAALTGRYAQRPPIFSAKKVGGRVAHRLARRGEALTLTPHTVEITRFELRGRSGADVEFEVEVGSGAYIRALARDLGERLGCGAHLRRLRRIAIGRFQVEDATSPDRATPAITSLRPAGDAVAHLPQRQVDDTEQADIRQGKTIPAIVAGPGPVALRRGEHLVAIAEPAGDRLQPRVVLEP